MRLESDELGVTVVLSRRNVMSLINKVEDPKSHRAIIGGSDAEGLTVKVETDVEHYFHNDRQCTFPGEVHPDHDPGVDYAGRGD